MVKTRLIQDIDTQIFLLAIGFGHLKEGVDFANCRDVVRDKRFNLRVQFDLLGLVPLNVLKNVFDLLRNGQVRIGVGVVSSWHFLLVLVVFVILSLVLALLHVLLSALLLLLLLLGVVSIELHVHFVFFLF